MERRSPYPREWCKDYDQAESVFGAPAAVSSRALHRQNFAFGVAQLWISP
jgi:hypothetical protein